MKADAHRSPGFSRMLVACAAGLVVASCTIRLDLGLEDVFGRPDPPQLYVLRPEVQAPPGPGVAWQLAVAVPQATALLDTERMAVQPTPTTFDYLADVAWPDTAPRLIQALLIEALERTGRVSASRDTGAIAADYVLQTDLRDFQARYDTPLPPPDEQDGTAAPRPPPRVVVQIEARLVALPERRIVRSLTVASEAQAGVNTTEGIAVAFNSALGQALGQIVEWVLRTPPGA